MRRSAGGKAKQEVTQSRRAKGVSTRAEATKKIVFDMPRPLYEEATAAQVELRLKDTSSFMRLAVKNYLSDLKRKKLERELEEGYLANADLIDEVHSDFLYVDSE